MKAILYYTDNKLDDPIYSIVQEQLLKVELPIISVSLMPISFGKNVVRYFDPCYITMVKQIIAGLEVIKEDYVFFCEHDVLYPKSHFDFTPSRNDIFYYNSNVWRWDYPKDRLITYDRLISLSSLCAYSEFVLDHYKARLEVIEINEWDNDPRHEPEWARKWGYEPGTKKTKRGGFSNDDFEMWQSSEPIIDIRHNETFSQRKVTLDSFKHQPTGWKETTINKIGWDLKGMFE